MYYIEVFVLVLTLYPIQKRLSLVAQFQLPLSILLKHEVEKVESISCTHPNQKILRLLWRISRAGWIGISSSGRSADPSGQWCHYRPADEYHLLLGVSREFSRVNWLLVRVGYLAVSIKKGKWTELRNEKWTMSQILLLRRLARIYVLKTC